MQQTGIKAIDFSCLGENLVRFHLSSLSYVFKQSAIKKLIGAWSWKTDVHNSTSLIALKKGISSNTDDSASDNCEDWDIFGPGLGGMYLGSTH